MHPLCKCHIVGGDEALMTLHNLQVLHVIVDRQLVLAHLSKNDP